MLSYAGVLNDAKGKGNQNSASASHWSVAHGSFFWNQGKAFYCFFVSAYMGQTSFGSNSDSQRLQSSEGTKNVHSVFLWSYRLNFMKIDAFENVAMLHTPTVKRVVWTPSWNQTKLAMRQQPRWFQSAACLHWRNSCAIRCTTLWATSGLYNKVPFVQLILLYFD